MGSQAVREGNLLQLFSGWGEGSVRVLSEQGARRGFKAGLLPGAVRGAVRGAGELGGESVGAGGQHCAGPRDARHAAQGLPHQVRSLASGAVGK